MSIDEIVWMCNAAISAGIQVRLIIQKGSMPRGFPRGTLISETHKGNYYSFNPHKVKTYIEAIKECKR